VWLPIQASEIQGYNVVYIGQCCSGQSLTSIQYVHHNWSIDKTLAMMSNAPQKMRESMFLKSIACAPRQWYTKDSVFQLTQKMFRIMTLFPAFSPTKRYVRWSDKENVDTSMRWVVIFTGFIPSCKMYKSQCRTLLNDDFKNVGDNASVISTKSHF